MSNRSLAGNVVSGVLAQVWTVLIGLVMVPIFVRKLGSSSYGLLALCLTVVGVGGVMDMGIGRSLGKIIARERGRGDPSILIRFFQVSVGLTLSMGLAVGVLMMVSAPLLARYLFHVPAGQQAEAEACLITTAIGLPAVLLRLALEGLLSGHERITFLNFATACSNSLRGLLGILAACLGAPLWVILAANVLATYAGIGLLTWYGARHMPIRFSLKPGWDLKLARELFAEGAVYSACLLAGFAFIYFDRLLIAGFLPFVMVGYYTGCFDLAGRQWYISNNIGQAFFPRFSEQASRGDTRLEDSYWTATRGVVIATTGCSAILVALAGPILRLWLGAEFEHFATATLVFQVSGVMLSCYTAIPYTLIFAATNKLTVYLRFYAVAACLHLGLSLLLLQRFKIAGVAASFAISYLYVWIQSLLWVRQRVITSVTMLTMCRRCFLPAWLIASAIGALLWFGRGYISNFLELIVIVVLAYLAYFGLVVVVGFSRVERGELWNAGRNMLKLEASSGRL